MTDNDFATLKAEVKVDLGAVLLSIDTFMKKWSTVLKDRNNFTPLQSKELAALADYFDENTDAL